MNNEQTAVLTCEPRDLPAKLTREEFGTRTRVHTRTVDRWIALGRIKACKVGGRVLIDRAELTRLLSKS